MSGSLDDHDDEFSLSGDSESLLWPEIIFNNALVIYLDSQLGHYTEDGRKDPDADWSDVEMIIFSNKDGDRFKNLEKIIFSRGDEDYFDNFEHGWPVVLKLLHDLEVTTGITECN